MEILLSLCISAFWTLLMFVRFDPSIRRPVRDQNIGLSNSEERLTEAAQFNILWCFVFQFLFVTLNIIFFKRSWLNVKFPPLVGSPVFQMQFAIFLFGAIAIVVCRCIFTFKIKSKGLGLGFQMYNQNFMIWFPPFYLPIFAMVYIEATPLHKNFGNVNTAMIISGICGGAVSIYWALQSTVNSDRFYSFHLSKGIKDFLNSRRLKTVAFLYLFILLLGKCYILDLVR